MAEYKTDTEDVTAENKMDTATLYDSDGNLCLPVDLWREMTGDETKDLPAKVSMTKERLSNVCTVGRTNANTVALRQKIHRQTNWIGAWIPWTPLCCGAVD